MQNIDLIIGGLFLAIVTIFIYLFYKRRKRIANRDREQEAPPTNEVVYNRAGYIKHLSLQEKIELSWKFLYEITELIVMKFSIEDKNAVNQYGHKLLGNGMRYEHVPDLGIKHNVVNASTSIEQTPSQSQRI